MAVSQILSAALSGPKNRLVDEPLRELIESVLDEKQLATKAQVRDLEATIGTLQATVRALSPRVDAAEQRASHLAQEVERLRTTIDDLTRDLAEAREQTMDAVARADAAEAKASQAEDAAHKAEAALSEAKAELSAAASAPVAEPADDRPVVGPAGEVVVNGKTFRVDEKHAGERYSVAHNGAVRVGRRLVKKHKIKS